MAYIIVILALNSEMALVRVQLDGQTLLFNTLEEAARYVAAHAEDIHRCGYSHAIPVKFELDGRE